VNGSVRRPDDRADECGYADLLSGLLDGELTPAEQARVEQHLEVHEACRRELEDIRQVRDIVRSLPWVDGPADFWGAAVASTLAAALAEAVAAVAAVPSAAAAAPAVRRTRSARATRWLWGSAAAALLFVAASLAGTQVDQPSSTSDVTTPSISTARGGAEPVVTSASSGPAVGQQLVAHNDGVDDAMDGVATFLRMP
jgi:anti-sigma factor RsiW